MTSSHLLPFGILVLLLSFYCNLSNATQVNLPTVTVRGFLNFRTTVDGTVIVFTPASATAASTASASAAAIEFTNSYNEIKATPSQKFEARSTSNFPDVASIQNVEKNQYPTGLVTVLKGAVVANGVTTVYETNVIGTYIDGKYAQVLKSSSNVLKEITTASSAPVMISRAAQHSEIRLSSSFIEPSSVVSAQSTPIYKPAPAKPGPPKFLFKSKNDKIQVPERKSNFLQPSFKSRDAEQLNGEPTTRSTAKIIKGRFNRFSQNKREPESTNNQNTNNNENNRVKIRIPGRDTAKRLAWSPRQSPRVKINRFKVKVPSQREKNEDEAAKETNQRFQHRIGLHKPKNEIKLKKEIIKSNLNNDNEYKPVLFGSENKLDVSPATQLQSTSPIEPHKVVKEVQTITTEVIQHVNGNSIRADTITLVTTLERTVHPSEFLLHGPIEPTIPAEGNDVDATKIEETPPIVISRTYSVTERSMRTTVIPGFDGTLATNHTVTESFFIRKLITAYKTMPPGDLHLFETASMEMNNISFADSISGTEQSIAPSIFEGKIEFRDNEEENSIHPTAVVNFRPTTTPILEPSLNQFPQAPQFPQIDLNNPLIINAALRNPQLAAIYFGLQQLSQQATQYETVTKPTEYLTTETLYTTKLISFYDGRQTRTRSITEPKKTIERTLTSYTTEVSQVMNPQVFYQQQQLQKMFASQLLGPNNPIPLQTAGSIPMAVSMPANNFNNLNTLNNFNSQNNNAKTIINTVTTVSTIKSTSTKIYTLIYNAFSTRYRTVTSTELVPTTVTTYSTTTIAQTQLPGFNPYFG